MIYLVIGFVGGVCGMLLVGPGGLLRAPKRPQQRVWVDVDDAAGHLAKRRARGDGLGKHGARPLSDDLPPTKAPPRPREDAANSARPPRDVLKIISSSPADPPGTVTMLYDGWCSIAYVPKRAEPRR